MTYATAVYAINRSTAKFSDIEVDLPSFECLVAGTFALMTGYAEHDCEVGDAMRRDALAKKIVSNLRALASHPRASNPLLMVFNTLQGHWNTLACLYALESKVAA